MSGTGERWCARRWLAPGFELFVFAVVLAAIWVNPEMPLRDPGTGWHIVAGREFLESGRIPREDGFSFTAQGREWVGGAWLFDAAAAWLVSLGGLPLLTVWCGLLSALVPVILYRRMLSEGAWAPVALACAMLAQGVLLMHTLNRPHVVSYVLFAWLITDLARIGRREAGAGRLWLHAALMVVWCNCHRGFLAGLAAVAMFMALEWVAAARGRGEGVWRRCVGLSAAALAMAAATLCNPWGVRLHTATLEYLRLESVALWIENAPPDLLGGGSAVVAFEVMVLGVLGVLATGRLRVAPWEAVAAVFFLHQALRAERHMNLFAIVAAPMLARGLSALFMARPGRLSGALARVDGQQRAARGWIWQVPVAAVLFLAVSMGGRDLCKRDLDGIHLSRGAAEHIGASIARFDRMYNPVGLGGSLIYRFWPRLRVFVDDRNEIYGDRFLFGEYFPVEDARPGWEEVLGARGITAAILISGSLSDRAFRSSPNWAEDYRDARNAIYVRVRPGPRSP